MISGELDFDLIAKDDEAAIDQVTRVKRIGKWSAEIYLLFADGRPDIWPVGDFAVQVGLQKVLGLEPTSKWYGLVYVGTTLAASDRR